MITWLIENRRILKSFTLKEIKGMVNTVIPDLEAMELYKTKIKDFVADLDDNYLLETMMFMIESMNDRLTWDQYFSLIACVAKQRSSCERLKVGCLLVKDNRIISQGYNGFLPGAPHESVIRDNHEQATVLAQLDGRR